MRILHLLDPAHCGDEGLLCAADLIERPGAEHECWLLGSERDERRAWSLGIPTTTRVHPRARHGALSGLRRLWHDRRDHGGPDVVQCYSPSALGLARSVFDVARVAVLARPPLDARSLRRASDDDPGREVIAAFDEPTRRSIGAGSRLVDPPAFGPGGPVAVDRRSLRASLGLAPTDIALAWLADPPGAIDAMHVAYCGGVLMAAGHRTVSLLRRGARQERRGAAYLRAHGRRWGMLLADCSLPELIGAADACVVDVSPGATCGPVAASLALSMGVPIGAARGTFLTEPGSEWPVQPAISGAPGRIAVPIAAILEVPSLRANLTSAGRAWGDRTGFGRAMSDLWAEAALVGTG